MKIYTPAANIIIATLYLFFLILIGYITKRSLQQQTPILNKPIISHKYNHKNLRKALSQQKYSQQIPQLLTLIKSLTFKYSLIGTFFNQDKSYMLKQMFIISVICVACTVINGIVVWPIGIIVPIVIVMFCIREIVMNIDCRKMRVHQANQNNDPNAIEVQPVIFNLQGQQQSKPKTKSKQQNESHKPIKYIINVVIISFVTLVLISQTMFSLYNSVSNLGLLNLGSVAAIFVIDQILIRPALSGVFIGIIYICNKVSGNGKNIFSYTLVKNLCSNQLLKKIHEIQQENGTDQNFIMSVSPTKKKVVSPSKIPKAQPLYFQSETLMNLHSSRMNNKKSSQKIEQLEQNQQQQQQHQHQSPIKNLMISKNPSIYLTSAEKNMFGEVISQEQNLQNIDQNIQGNQLQKNKNNNQFYSVQRLPRDKNNTESIEGDNVILVETGLNAFDVNGPKKLGNKNHTLDVQFSPSKRPKRSMGYTKNKRQLIITGNSPYLQYLPDMMKKTDKTRKNTVPSQPQIHNGVTKIL